MRQRPTVVSTVDALARLGIDHADADARVDRDLVVVVRHADFFGRRVHAAEVAASILPAFVDLRVPSR